MALYNLRKKLASLKPVQLVVLSFSFVIIIGTILLTLPVSNQDGKWFPVLDALFTATSATCVTGLVVVPTFSQFSLFGQIVILLLIQIGGLGLVTIVAVILVIISKHLLQSEKIALSSALNTTSQFGLKRFLKFIISFVLVTELVGMCLLSIQFIPLYGISEGLYQALFTSISAFCNAGFDVLGNNSLALFSNNWFISIVVSLLIICGGLGFAVWFDIIRHLKRVVLKSETVNKARGRAQMQTRLVLKSTIILLVLGMVVYLLAEFNNPHTIGNYDLNGKLVASMFQSATLRTAGFYTVDFSLATQFTKLFSSILMFIGGSPGGTAGGIKTTTLAVVILFLKAEAKGNGEIVYHKRTISKTLVQRSLAIITVSLVFLVVGILILSVTENFALEDLVFEVASALGTVGISTGITPSLSVIGKITIIILMFIGRIGPIVMVLFLASRSAKGPKDGKIRYPDVNILVG